MATKSEGFYQAVVLLRKDGPPQEALCGMLLDDMEPSTALAWSTLASSAFHAVRELRGKDGDEGEAFEVLQDLALEARGEYERENERDEDEDDDDEWDWVSAALKIIGVITVLYFIFGDHKSCEEVSAPPASVPNEQGVTSPAPETSSPRLAIPGKSDD